MSLLLDRLGGTALVVTIAGNVVPLDSIGPVSIRHGRSGVDDQPDPATCQLALYGDALPTLPTIGAEVRVELGASAQTALGASDAQWSGLRPRFLGTISDLTAAPGAAGVYGPGMLSITAVSRVAHLGRVYVGDEPWPAERDGARVSRILALAASTAGLTVGIVDPGTVDVLGRDVDRQLALPLLTGVADDAGGVLVGRRDGVIEYHDAEHRRGVEPLVTLAADDVLANARWAQQLSGLVNDLTVAYGVGSGSDQPSVRITDTASVAAYGSLAASTGTQLADGAAAGTRALDVVGRRSVPKWRLESLTVEMLRTLDPAQTVALGALEVGSLLAITGFPTAGPFTAARLYVEGWAEAFTDDGWQLELDVTEYALTGTPPRWADVPTATTWGTAGPVTWLSALSWYFGEPAGGRWADVPAGDQWTEVPTGTTWQTA